MEQNGPLNVPARLHSLGLVSFPWDLLESFVLVLRLTVLLAGCVAIVWHTGQGKI